MRIAVTGANGYLGVGIVKQLLDDGHDVIAADIDTGYVDVRAKKINSNLFSEENPYKKLDCPEVLLHLAWRDGFKHASEAHIDDLPKHMHFISKMIEGGVKQVAVLGSMHEIGFYEGEVDENTPTNPLSLYGISKNALREIVKGLCEKSNVTFLWLRGYYIVGNSEHGSSIFSKLVAAEKRGEEKFPFTTGKCEYDFLAYDEFCNMVAKAATQDEITGIINICSGKSESLGSRVESFIKDNNFKIKLEYGVFPERAYDSKAIWGNSDKINAILENAGKH